MTRKFYQIGLIIAVAASVLATPTFAGSKERDFLKKLLFPPIPILVPGKNKIIDLNAALRKGKLPVPPRPPIVIPRVRVTVRHNDTYRPRRDRSHRHDHHVEQPRVHTCRMMVFSTMAPPQYRKISCATPRPTRHHAWVSGHWQRHCCGWKWTNGRWELPPTYNSVWIQGSWIQTTRGWQWLEGGWSTPTCY